MIEHIIVVHCHIDDGLLQKLMVDVHILYVMIS